MALRLSRTSSAEHFDASTPLPWLQTFTHADKVGFGIIDDRLRYQFANRAIGRINGIPAEAHLGKTPQEVLGAGAKPIEEALKSVFRTGVATPVAEWSAKLDPITERGHWIHTHLPVRGTSGAVAAVAAVVIDVTAQRNLERWFRQVNRNLLQLRGRDAHRLSEDLKASITGYHSALALTLAYFSRGVDKNPDGLARVVSLLDKRLETIHDLVIEVMKRFRTGQQR
jgi:hypothetical protein